MSTVAEPFYVTGGTLSATALSYIEREADRALFDAVMAGQFSYVLNSRQMGKSSLCVRTMDRLNLAGVRTAFIDLTRIGGRNVTAEQWYAGLLGELGRNLELRSEMLQFWRGNTELGPMQRLFASLREVALTRIQGPIAIFIDEIDVTRSLSFDKDEFFAGIRECYNRRVEDPAYGRLTFCLLGVALPNDLISNPISTPFNIGKRIFLKDFTLEEVRGFARGMSAVDQIQGGAPRNGVELVERVHYWTHGHPFLTQSLCSAVAQTPAIRTIRDVDDLIRRDLFEPKSRETNINLADVANRALNAGIAEPDPEKFRADLLSIYGRARDGKVAPDDESNRAVALLKLSGLVRSDGVRIHVRNRIYENVFDHKWIRDNMPGQELRRQRRAFWTGALRVTLISGLVIAALTTLAVINYRLALEARRQRDRAEYEAYVSQVDLMRTAYEDRDRYQLGQLLERTSGSPYRGMEWSYWYGRLHDGDYEVSFPKNVGYPNISGDGKSVVIVDESAAQARIYSFPDLRPLSPVFAMPRQNFPLWTLHGWVTAEAADAETMRFVDPFSRIPIATYKRPGLNLLRSAWSVNGRFFGQAWLKKGDLTSTSFDLRDTDSKLISYFPVVGSFIDYPAISDDGKRLAFRELPLTHGYSPDHFVARVRDGMTGKILDEFDPPQKTSRLTVGFSPSGRYIAINAQGGKVIVRDIVEHRDIWSTTVDGPSLTLAFADHDRILFARTGSGDFYAWNWGQNRLIRKIPGGVSDDGTFIDPDGRFIAVVDGGTRVYRLSGQTRPPIYRIAGPVPHVRGITPAGDIEVRAGERVVYLDSKTLAPSRPAVPLPDLAGNVSEDGMYLVRCGPLGADVVSLEEGRSLFHRPEVKNGYTFGVTPDGQRFLIIDNGSPVARLYDRSGRVLSAIKLESIYVPPFVAVSQDSRLIAFGGDDGKVLVLDHNGKLVQRLFAPEVSFTGGCGFDQTGSKLAVGYGLGSLFVFDLTGKAPPVECVGHQLGVYSVQFDTAGDRLLSAGNDGTIRLWDPKTGRELLRLPIARSQRVTCRFTKDDRAIVYCNTDGYVRRLELSPPNVQPGPSGYEPAP